MDETTAISLIRQGNKAAFAGIVDTYQAPLQRYLFRLTGDRDLAEDLTQDTFVQAYRNLLATDREISLRAWLYRIAENNARQYFRRKKLLSFIPFTGNEEPKSKTGGTETTELSLDINATLMKLPLEQRSCIILHFIEGLTYREIGETLAISEEAVRKRVSRGSHRFKQLYAPGGGSR